MEYKVPHNNAKKSGSACRTLRGHKGAALIPIIIAIVIMGTLGAVLLSLSSVGTFSPILGNSAQRAYYLAESGYRYAALKFRQGGESMLDDLNAQTFSVGDNQEFSLEFRTHKLRVTGGGGSDTLDTEVPFGFVPQVPTGNVSGYLKIGNIPAQEFSYVEIPGSYGITVNFESDSGNWNAEPGDQARFAALSDGSAVSEEGGDLQLQSGTQAAEFFPKHNARFTADGKIYQYRTRDSENDRLLGVTRVDGPWEPPSLNPNGEIILNDFVSVHSTGSYGQGFLGGIRHLTYNVPFSEASGGETFHDTFDNKDHWVEETDGSSAEGAHEVRELEGDSALAVTNTSKYGTPGLDSSLIEFNRASTGLNMKEEWSLSGNYLSYDAQVKIMSYNEPVFMDGISFRLDENLNSYGISFLQADAANSDGIPDSIVPQPPGQAMVVLWERNGNIDNWENWTWLAYHTLESNEIFIKSFFEDDMESGDSKWNSEGDWTLISSDSHSGDYCWRDVPEGPNPRNSTRTLESISFDLPEASNPILSFWHHYSIWTFRGNARGRVEISTDQGENWERLGQDYQGYLPDWTRQQINLSDYAGIPDVRIRFKLTFNGSPFASHYEDWYVDDIKIYDPDWPTLLASVKEAESISFINGGHVISDGDTVEGASSGATATIYTDPVLTSGSFAGNDAEGDILLRDVSGNFQGGEALLVGGEQVATVDSVNGKQNYIRAYIGDQQEHGDPGNPLDRERLANPRGEVNWPPRDADDTDPGNDYYTLVQWNDSLEESVTRLGTGNEENAVIRTNTLTTPDANFPDTRPELGLHTWGWGSSGGEPDAGEIPDIYFDDFAVRLDDPIMSGGFAPAIQESAAGQ